MANRAAGVAGATIGVEEEFHILDATSFALAPAAPRLLRQELAVDAEAELKRSMVETSTDVHTDLSMLRADLVARRLALRRAAEPLGLALAASGTVPASGWGGTRVMADPRYEWLDREYRQLVDEQQVCACQVQIGVPDRDLAVRVTRRLRRWLPTLLALSTSSPMFQGGDTGYASFRTIAVSRWPTVGPSPDAASAEEYDQISAELIATGVIADPKMIYFDTRVSARYPTVEIRIADACPLIDDVMVLAALSRALVVTAVAEDAAGEPLPEANHLLLRAATWRAARSGLSGDLVEGGRPLPAAEAVEVLLGYVRPVLEIRGEWAEVTRLTSALLARGNSAQRQRAVLAAGGSLSEVVAEVVKETAAE